MASVALRFLQQAERAAATEREGSFALIRLAATLSEGYYRVVQPRMSRSEFFTEKAVSAGKGTVKCVGLKYFRGVVHSSEYVTPEREPTNQHDRNAIRILNMHGIPVGHIKATMASELAPIMDFRAHFGPKIEALVPHRGRSQFDMDVEISFLCLDVALPLWHKWLAGQHSFIVHRSSIRRPEITPIQVQSVTQSRFKSQEDLDQLFDSAESAKDGVEIVVPATSSLLRSELYDFQRHGVSWMISREKNTDLPPTWEATTEQGCQVYLNMLTRSSQSNRPEPVTGGILADTMGLGKTLQSIALILYNPPPGVEYKANEEEASVKPEPSLPLENDVELPISESPKLKADENPAEQTPTKEIQLPTYSNQAFSSEDLQAMRVAELKGLLQAQYLSKTGRKDVLIQRLLDRQEVTKTLRVPSPSSNSTEVKNETCAIAAPVTPIIVEAPSRLRTNAPVSSVDPNKPRGTLIVVPTSVISAWTGQLAQHVAPGALSVYEYHGSGRKQSPDFLRQFDVVITTYGTLTAEFSGETSSSQGEDLGEMAFLSQESLSQDSFPSLKRTRAEGILSIDWWRIILDEAHTIRTRSTKGHKACLALKAKNRWALTGTPLFNGVDDIQSLFAFLKMTPVNDYAIWKRAISRGIEAGDEICVKYLRLIVHTICLRRVKENVLKLPEMVIELQKMDLAPEQRQIYDSLFKSAQAVFETAQYISMDEVLRNYLVMLECITRLRQACLDPSLVPCERLDKANAILNKASEQKELTPEEATKLLTKLKELLGHGEQDESAKEGEGIECVVCSEPFKSESTQILRTCKHAFCSECCKSLVNHHHMTCPLCRTPFTAKDFIPAEQVFVVAAKKEVDEDLSANPAEQNKSAEVPAKIRALLQSIQGMRKNDPTLRFVIFCTFTKFLDRIQQVLTSESVTCCRIDGTMTSKQRVHVVNQFQNDEDAPTTMLISLKAGGQGITLTRASVVFVMDPWWNAAAEAQAYDRVHRIGQTRPVKVVRFVIENSIEERVVLLQEEKAALSHTILSKKPSAEEIRAIRLGQLTRIFS